ncbi:uncharacterized protein with NRDE domain [Paucimonas lemoignei]|uniref:Uncharacterized protein with NRDE domain n=1 Tax=Paucimonas lemoignei TaxID=29443 RepID=A0A4R3I450_PAULE|nr:uncharacterized protein with NRDE domain [Paucimonas lemoignei]
MCLIVFAWQVIPGTPLIAAGNRDEFYDRPAQPADWWPDYPHVYAGRDLKGGGTWIGITRDSRFAAITNVRAPAEMKTDAPTRGRLVADYLAGEFTPAQYIENIAADADKYNGFNLLIGDREQLIWYSNRSDDERNGKPLAPGVYGLSNAGLDCCWPKVVRTKAQFASLLCQAAPEERFSKCSPTRRALRIAASRKPASASNLNACFRRCISNPTITARVRQPWSSWRPMTSRCSANVCSSKSAIASVLPITSHACVRQAWHACGYAVCLHPEIRPLPARSRTGHKILRHGFVH